MIGAFLHAKEAIYQIQHQSTEAKEKNEERDHSPSRKPRGAEKRSGRGQGKRGEENTPEDQHKAQQDPHWSRNVHFPLERVWGLSHIQAWILRPSDC